MSWVSKRKKRKSGSGPPPPKSPQKKSTPARISVVDEVSMRKDRSGSMSLSQSITTPYTIPYSVGSGLYDVDFYKERLGLELIPYCYDDIDSKDDSVTGGVSVGRGALVRKCMAMFAAKHVKVFSHVISVNDQTVSDWKHTDIVKHICNIKTRPIKLTLRECDDVVSAEYAMRVFKENFHKRSAVTRIILHPPKTHTGRSPSARALLLGIKKTPKVGSRMVPTSKRRVKKADTVKSVLVKKSPPPSPRKKRAATSGKKPKPPPGNSLSLLSKTKSPRKPSRHKSAGTYFEVDEDKCERKATRDEEEDDDDCEDCIKKGKFPIVGRGRIGKIKSKEKKMKAPSLLCFDLEEASRLLRSTFSAPRVFRAFPDMDTDDTISPLYGSYRRLHELSTRLLEMAILNSDALVLKNDELAALSRENITLETALKRCEDSLRIQMAMFQDTTYDLDKANSELESLSEQLDRANRENEAIMLTVKQMGEMSLVPDTGSKRARKRVASHRMQAIKSAAIWKKAPKLSATSSLRGVDSSTRIRAQTVEIETDLSASSISSSDEMDDGLPLPKKKSTQLKRTLTGGRLIKAHRKSSSAEDYSAGAGGSSPMLKEKKGASKTPRTAELSITRAKQPIPVLVFAHGGATHVTKSRSAATGARTTDFGKGKWKQKQEAKGRGKGKAKAKSKAKTAFDLPPPPSSKLLPIEDASVRSKSTQIRQRRTPKRAVRASAMLATASSAPKKTAKSPKKAGKSPKKAAALSHSQLRRVHPKHRKVVSEAPPELELLSVFRHRAKRTGALSEEDEDSG